MSQTAETIEVESPMLSRDQVEHIAQHCFGWKWMAWPGRPMRSHPQYDIVDEMMVRTFMSPEQMQRVHEEPNWVDYWKRTGHQMVEATGEEPLAYQYGSSAGFAWPQFTDLDVRDWVIANWMPGSDNRRRFDMVMTSLYEYREWDFCKAVLIVLSNQEHQIQFRFSDEMKAKMPQPSFTCANTDCAKLRSFDPRELRWSEEEGGWYCKKCGDAMRVRLSRFTLDDLQREVGWTHE